MSVADKTRQLIADNAVMVFSKSHCPYCFKAKRALSSYPVQAKIIELDQMSDGDAYQDALQTITGGRTVPRVFIGGKFIGGGDDAERLHSAGQLRALLIAAKAM